MPKKIALVSGASQKAGWPGTARDLYLSPWFLKARAYAERNADAWYILSAKYGLVTPGGVIAPYDLALQRLPAAERRAWAERVIGKLRGALKAGDQVIILAGEPYRAGLVDPIRAMGCTVEIPMEGLAIGEQLHWLSEHLG